MKKLSFFVIIILLIVFGFLFTWKNWNKKLKNTNSLPTGVILETKVIAENLDIPWDLAFLPDGKLLVTERSGRLLLLQDEKKLLEIPIEGVKPGGESGLLGIALHPGFDSNRFLYVYSKSGGKI